MRLRSVELELPDVGRAAEFLAGPWGLVPAGSAGGTQFFRGSGTHPYILSVAKASAPAVVAITFAGSEAEIGKTDRTFDVPGGGKGYEVRGPENQTYRFITDTVVEPLKDRDKPIQLTHAVLNTVDQEAVERFAVEKLGFKVADRTAHMRFLRCNRKHHCVAYAKAATPSLNHIAFEMKDVDAVMRGIGRMRESGFECVWGPGRHGPGNNVFAYFIGPDNFVIEYTAEVEKVDESYRVRAPGEWAYPPGHSDLWGATPPPSARMKAAQSKIGFAAGLFRP